MRDQSTFVLALTLTVLAAAGCSEPASPTRITPPGGTEAPQASLAVTVDGLGSTEAIAALSEVTFDARQSAGQGAAYRIDFGDGTSGNQSLVKHVYSNAGVFTATLTVTSTSGQTATASQKVTVASPLGSWLFRGYVGRPQRLHVRTLNLTLQNGRTMQGVLGTPGQHDRVVTGTLSGERNIRLVTEDQAEVFEGILPGVITGNAVSLNLLASGGAANNEQLTFVPLSGPPSGPGPDVSFNIRFFSFDAPFAIRGFSPILFDASVSRGDDLRYFIEFGDGEVATNASAVHPIDREGRYTARFTVVDRFGRVNQESTTFDVLSLVYGEFWHAFDVARQETTYLNFLAQDGNRVSGKIGLGPPRYTTKPLFDFTGTLSGQNEIQIALAGTDIVLTGTLALRCCTERLVLTQAGGADHGRVYAFRLYHGF